MFDLITGTTERPLRERAPGSKVTSFVLHAVVLTAVVGIPLLRVTNTLPDAPTMLAFATAPPAPPPPPPPPAPARPAEPRPIEQPAQKQPEQMTAPIEAPVEVRPEATTGTASAVAAVEGGVAGGVEGGVVGGVIGGVLGGIVSSVPPPPPAPVVPVRIGGQINTPALVRRVEPVYPEVAAAAHLVGTVILEAVVGTDGRVESVKVLRPRHVLLDNAAVAALKQWRYSPLVLNGVTTPFILTVTFTFSTK